MMPLKPINWKATVTLRRLSEKVKTYTFTGPSEHILASISGITLAAEAAEFFVIVEEIVRVEA